MASLKQKKARMDAQSGGWTAMFRSMRNKIINVFSTRDGLPRKAVFLWEWLTRKREEIDRDTVVCEASHSMPLCPLFGSGHLARFNSTFYD
jgi:hypothetical protein